MVNGQDHQVDPALSLSELVASFADSSEGVAVAINSNVIPKSSWPSTKLNRDDIVEILTAAAGG